MENWKVRVSGGLQWHDVHTVTIISNSTAVGSLLLRSGFIALLLQLIIFLTAALLVYKSHSWTHSSHAYCTACNTGATRKPVGKYVKREIYSRDESLGTVGFFLVLSHDLESVRFFKMAVNIRICSRVPLYRKLSIFFKTVDFRKKRVIMEVVENYILNNFTLSTCCPTSTVFERNAIHWKTSC